MVMLQSVRRLLGHGGLLCLLVLTIGSPVSVTATPTKRDTNVCETQACRDAAEAMSDAMNTSVDPCDNFYQYACGGWEQKHEIPDDASFITPIYFMAKELNKVANELIIGDVDSSLPAVFQKPIAFYRSCMDNGTIEKLGNQPLMTLLQELGGWPMIDDTWTPSGFDLTATLAKLRMLSSNYLFVFAPWNDLNNSSAMVLSFHQPMGYGIGSRDSYYSKKTAEKLAAYKNATLAVVQKLKGSAASEQDVDDMIAFEIELVNITIPWTTLDAQSLADQNNRYTVARMNTEYPAIDWSRFVDMVFNRPEVGITIPSDEIVINYVPEFFTRLNNLLGRTDKKTIANLLMWRLAKSMLSSLSLEYQLINLNLQKVLTGVKKLKDRTEACSSDTGSQYGKILGNMYVTRYIDSTTKLQVELMVDDLKKAFSEQVNEADWMDAVTRAIALEKNREMNKGVAYSDEILDINYLDEYYRYVTVEEDKYFMNSINMVRDESSKELKELRKFQDKRLMEVDPMVVNARQMFAKNALAIYGGILKPPFFGAGYPKYLNYAGIGMVIGHEITHGFDNTGRAFDKDGNACDWWTKQSNEEFEKRAECFINQYNGFVSPEANSTINGNKTLPENLGDCGGIRQAYRAYKTWVREHNNGLEEKPLPGLGLTVDKLFFLNYAQVWCGKITPQKAQSKIENDVHSQHSFRVIGPLQNSEDFANAYGCTPGSYMNPEKKCVIW